MMDPITMRCISLGRELAGHTLAAAVHLSNWVAWHVDGRVLDEAPDRRRSPRPG
jgi:hypothetical protein